MLEQATLIDALMQMNTLFQSKSILPSPPGLQQAIPLSLAIRTTSIQKKDSFPPSPLCRHKNEPTEHWNIKLLFPTHPPFLNKKISTFYLILHIPCTERPSGQRSHHATCQKLTIALVFTRICSRKTQISLPYEQYPSVIK